MGPATGRRPTRRSSLQYRLPVTADNDAYDLLEAETTPFHVGNRTKSTALLAWFINTVLREDPDDVEAAICDGGGDKGIDGLIFDEDANELLVLQAKHRASSNSTQGDADLKAFVGTAPYFAVPGGIDKLLESRPNQELANLIARLDLRTKLEERDPSVRFIFVTNGNRDASAVSYLDSIATIDVSLELWDRDQLADIAQRTISKGVMSSRVVLDSVEGALVSSFSEGAQIAIALVPATELVRIPGIEELTVFDLNVRLDLGNTKINRELRGTITKADEHELFPAYHNGLTILTKHLEYDDDAASLTLDGISVVNGCQSLLALWRERAKLTPKLKLVVKVVEVGTSNQLADQITYRSNNQNPVNIRDQRSNDRIQRDLQVSVATEYGSDLYYDIRRGDPPAAGVSRLDNQLAAQLLTAIWLKEPQNAVRKVRLFDHDYHRIFRRATASQLMLASLINDAIVDRRETLAPELQTAFASARFTIAYLVGVFMQQSPLGEQLYADPKPWLERQRDELKTEIKHAVEFVIDEMNFFVRNQEDAKAEAGGSTTFDPKTIFKSAAGVRGLERQVTQAVKVVSRRPEASVLFNLKA